MHERGVAVDLVRAAGVVALGQGASRVRTLKIAIGPDSHVDPQSLGAQVEWHARGTICEGAAVEVAVSPPPTDGRPDDRVQLVSIEVDG